ncbi:MAG: DegT/DnrJ/EryC1/StrS family aminotransferase [Candidatus Omnitrophica bacterium]|nr:DegT/DnrJ/EryC1/StrS family aminotransferase [Candidatus Omnitrophota bacterium]
MKVPYSYLDRQFADIDAYLEDIRALVESGDFTLGKPVDEFEKSFARLCGLPYAIGVGSGTDALILSLKILGIGPGDEVITTPNTFISTVGAIVMVGARPVFVDNNEEYTIDAAKIEKVITKKTKAILPVHLTGCPADMPTIMKIAHRHKVLVVEDAAQAILASIDGKHMGSWGETACFSLHPLKNLNVWGDGGVIVTRSAQLCRKLKLFRDHGMVTRDEIEMFSHNSRLDSIQAVVGNRLIGEVHSITDKRIANARRFDDAFKGLDDYIKVPPRRVNVKRVYHTYVLRVKDRDKLLAHLIEKGIRAKIHYPIPVHLQKAAKYLGYKRGDFPVCEQDARTILTLPVHQHLTSGEMEYMIDCVKGFYAGRKIKGVKKHAACCRG